MLYINLGDPHTAQDKNRMNDTWDFYTDGKANGAGAERPAMVVLLVHPVRAM